MVPTRISGFTVIEPAQFTLNLNSSSWLVGCSVTVSLGPVHMLCLWSERIVCTKKESLPKCKPSCCLEKREGDIESKDVVSNDLKREVVILTLVYSGSPKCHSLTLLGTFGSLNLKTGGFLWLNDVLIFKTLLTGAMSIYTSTFLTMQVSANAHNPSPLLVYFETAKHSWRTQADLDRLFPTIVLSLPVFPCMILGTLSALSKSESSH